MPPPRPVTNTKAGTGLIVLLILGFVAAVLVRVLAGGENVAYSASAGLLFAVLLVALAWPELGMGDETQVTPSRWFCLRQWWRILIWGLAGAVFMFLPVTLFHIDNIFEHARPDGNYFIWALVVSLVAGAEELFLRGRLYHVVSGRYGIWPAIILGAILFAALHIPLYGWQTAPLNLAAGMWLGALRYGSGSWTAPAITHIAVDLAAWWVV